MLLGLSLIGFFCAVIPAAMFWVNLRHFHAPPPSPLSAAALPAVSVLIPARDEASGIHACLEAALHSEAVHVEVVVLDDDSSDATAEIVAALSRNDPRVRCLTGPPLPLGWNGKQHACYHLAQAARFDRWLFLDADVRLGSHALRDLLQYQDESEVALLSAFPHQQTGTILEAWLVPMMHFLLLGFLPLRRMRQRRHPAYAAGCGQLFLTRASDYARAGTHAAIASSRHDGLKLPRVYRRAGLMTDVIDGTDLAQCRMYHGAAEVIRGLMKNATEGMANVRLIVPFSILLLGGSLLPWGTLLWSLGERRIAPMAVSLVAIAASHLPRGVSVRRFRQPLIGAVCHSLATPLFVAIQWVALWNHLAGRQVPWRGRTEGNEVPRERSALDENSQGGDLN